MYLRIAILTKQEKNRELEEAVLRNEEVASLVEQVNKEVPPGALEMAQPSGLDVGKMVRFLNLAMRCAIAREKLGRDIRGSGAAQDIASPSQGSETRHHNIRWR